MSRSGYHAALGGAFDLVGVLLDLCEQEMAEAQASARACDEEEAA